MTMALSARIDELSTTGVPFVHATVVRAQEPSSARPGDRAIILADGSIEGFVGGHCAAGSVRTAALDALKPFGIRHADMPLTPSRVWDAMQGRPTPPI